jgi:hypothetical protein
MARAARRAIAKTAAAMTKRRGMAAILDLKRRSAASGLALCNRTPYRAE